jgi:DNA invertase Pin-like site-specific DNA recombinase
MGNWWEIAAPDPDLPPLVRGIAYYRHSAQDRQENSIPIQQDQVRQWAREHGVEIIREFCDAGKSGLDSEGRPAFTEMMEEWIKKRSDFDYVLCLDVSRWGRFQDIDLSAQFSAVCKKHKKQVIYTTIGKPRENDPLYPVYVQFERFRAAQYSRELSDKVWRGCVKIAEQGYWAGGPPPYGLQRLLLDEKRDPLNVLDPGQRKGIQNQRVTLVEGAPDEVAVIRRIFHEFVELGHSEYKIAEGLNGDGIESPSGRRWGAGSVLARLRQEKYAGTMVYNQTSSKLKTPKQPNPPEQWVRTPEAFDGVIDYELFQRAQQLLDKQE